MFEIDNEIDIIGPEEERKSHGTALLLCFFLGALGVHRIYTGYTLIGLVQLLTGGGYGIWTLIDLISLWSNKFKDANGNELQDYDFFCVKLTILIPIIIILVLVFYFLRIYGII